MLKLINNFTFDKIYIFLIIDDMAVNLLQKMWANYKCEGGNGWLIYEQNKNWGVGEGGEGWSPNWKLVHL